MGGMIYIINIVKTLNYVEDDKKPEIFFFYSPELTRFLPEIDYPYINFIVWKFPNLLTGNIWSFIVRRNVFYHGLIDKYDLDVIYPAKNYPVKSKTKARMIAWYADLQHKYYPKFFTKATILHRNIRLYFILRNSTDLVVSSQAVKDDFIKFFNIPDGLKIHIFRFVSITNEYSFNNFQEIKAKYSLPDSYFLVSNQFHKHKNHRIVLLSFGKLREKGIIKHLAVTGKFPKASDSPYLNELHSIIEQFDLHDQISMLGIMPREEQIQIMAHSQAVIQPSFFEGWSTVIEDAKSLQVPVIASNLPVNIEQLGDNGIYFDPHNSNELASIILSQPNRDYGKDIYPDYFVRLKEAASTLYSILK
jgi:glycosyltransferase involved in cell wall biosynthesis